MTCEPLLSHAVMVFILPIFLREMILVHRFYNNVTTAYVESEFKPFFRFLNITVAFSSKPVGGK
jgi:hypothetical protein